MSIEWRSPNRIRYSIEDIVFILSHYSEIRQGLWPPEGRETGATEAPISKAKVSSNSMRQNIISIAAVVGLKLKPTEKDGELAIKLYDGTYCDTGLLEKQFEVLSKEEKLSREEIQDRTDCAIFYASKMTQSYGNFRKRFYERRYPA